MAMSKDRVKFFLPSMYFQNHHTPRGMHKDICASILSRAFGMHESVWRAKMLEFPEGISIVCRPSQFARFIVYRIVEGECVNGVKDLKCSIVVPSNPYQIVADEAGTDEAGTDEATVAQVARALSNLTGCPISPLSINGVVDVSKNPAG